MQLLNLPHALTVFLAALAFAPAATAEPQSSAAPTPAQLAAAVDLEQPQALALLERVVNINSGTMNFAGVRQVGEIFLAELQTLGFETRWVDGSGFKRAGHLIAERRRNGPRVLLIGHLDTVFDADSPFQRFERLSPGSARGPGVIDMKGGDVVALTALKALAHVGLLDKLSVIVVFTGDEEDPGEPVGAARQALLDAAAGVDAAIGFEDGSGDPKTAIVSRRGFTGWTLTATGQPAHSSQVFTEKVGAGAVYEVARALAGFYQRLSTEQLLSVNPGLVLGGTAVTLDAANARGTAAGKSNVVAGTAIATGDIRAFTPRQLGTTRAAMEEIARASLPHTSSTLDFDDSYPPMPPTDGNKHLLTMYDQASRDLGFGPVVATDPRAAGAADVSFVASRVGQVLDGVGLMGTADHTAQETADLTTLASQAKRIALLLARLAAAPK